MALWHSEKAQRYREQVGTAPECAGCTLESQRNYPSVLLSPKMLGRAVQMGVQMTRS